MYGLFTGNAFCARLKKNVPRISPRYSAQELQAQYDQFYEEMLRRYQQMLVAANKKAAEPTEHPLISVCLTHFNRPELLKKTLESLERQDYPNFEVLVMDDGSTQACKQKLEVEIIPILNRHKWKIFYQENQYLSAARNNLVPHAKGKWLLFMDDDNIALPQQLSTFMRVALASNAKIVSTNYFVANKKMPQYDALKFVFPFAVALNLNGQNILGDANSLVHKEAFNAIGGWYDEYGFGFSDQKFFIDALRLGIKREVCVEPVMIYNNAGKGHMSGINKNKYIAEIQTVFESYDELMHPELRHLAYHTFSLQCKTHAKSLIHSLSVLQFLRIKIKNLFSFRD